MAATSFQRFKSDPFGLIPPQEFGDDGGFGRISVKVRAGCEIGRPPSFASEVANHGA